MMRNCNKTGSGVSVRNLTSLRPADFDYANEPKSV